MTRWLLPLVVAACLAPTKRFSEAVRLSEGDAHEVYQAFRNELGQRREKDHLSYMDRLALFTDNIEAIEHHNSREASWKATVNRFADYTRGEFMALLGHRRNANLDMGAGRQSPVSFLEVRQKAIAATVDWRQKLNFTRRLVHNQGECGSCWAVAAVGALEMHAEMAHGMQRQLSYEQLVDCTPNPQHCGGDGGCKGATSQLALKYAKDHGLNFAEEYKGYESGGDGTCRDSGKPAIQIDGFHALPTNQLQPLLDAVANVGPVAMSVDASSWSFYSSGVFDGCDKDATVNHAVLLVGFGTDPAQNKNKDYWLIRNSWGDGWGENGYIRLLRHGSDQGDAGWCGTDHDPKQGNACDGGPATVPVCGMCGCLQDSSYPVGLRVIRK